MSVIITTEELDTYSGQTLETGRADQVVLATNDAIESITGRVWGETASGSEVHDYASVLFLRNMDIITVTSVKLNDATLEESSYKWRDTGRLVLSTRESGFNARYDEVEVDYTYGNMLVPDDLKQAALSLALDAYNYASDGQQKEVTSEGIGSLRYTYANGSDSSVGKGYLGTINRYKKARI